METLNPQGEYVDRKRTLPKRVVPLALHLTRLQPGRHVVVIEVDPDGRMQFETAQLSLDKNGILC
jgi:hypothetical protein